MLDDSSSLTSIYIVVVVIFCRNSRLCIYADRHFERTVSHILDLFAYLFIGRLLDFRSGILSKLIAAFISTCFVSLSSC